MIVCWFVLICLFGLFVWFVCLLACLRLCCVFVCVCVLPFGFANPGRNRQTDGASALAAVSTFLGSSLAEPNRKQSELTFCEREP